MSPRDKNGCNEYNALTRRRFLTGAGSAALTALTVPWLPKLAFAQSGSPSRDVLISIYLRGGADALSLCVPHGESAYYTLRPNIAVPRPGSGGNAAIDLDGFFGFPPAMAGLVEAYRAGHLLVVHAVGSPDVSRSHFVAQEVMERAADYNNPNYLTGWLGRHLASVAPLRSDSVLRAIDFDLGLARTLFGGPGALPIPDPSQFGISGNPATLPTRSNWIKQAYAAVDDPVRASAINTENTIALLQKINFSGYQPNGSAVYPDSDLGRGLQSTAALIKAQVGLEAAHIDVGGWDTHAQTGAVAGYMAGLMTGLSSALGAFHQDMFSSAFTNLTVVVLSEFGRNVAENGSQGTDHGHGGCMFLMGGAIAGGRVLTQWPGLDPSKQYQGQDLQTTIDYRDPLAEVLQKRLGNTNLAAVFPEYTPTFRGVTR